MMLVFGIDQGRERGVLDFKDDIENSFYWTTNMKEEQKALSFSKKI